MIRKDLVAMLLNNPRTAADIARELDVTPKDVEHDLQHLFKTLKKTDYRIIIHPAVCLKCDFRFSRNKITKPSKCPKCKATWIDAPLVEIKMKK